MISAVKIKNLEFCIFIKDNFLQTISLENIAKRPRGKYQKFGSVLKFIRFSVPVSAYQPDFFIEWNFYNLLGRASCKKHIPIKFYLSKEKVFFKTLMIHDNGE